MLYWGSRLINVTQYMRDTMSDPSDYNRRTYLQLLFGAGGISGLAGCSFSEGDIDTPHNESDRTETATDRVETADNTITPDTPPQILSYSATPTQNGTKLDIRLEAASERGLETLSVRYGTSEKSQEASNTRATLETELSTLDADISDPPGTVRFHVTDVGALEASVEVVPDEQAPRIETYQVSSTENAGNLLLKLEASDSTGLEEFRLSIAEYSLLDATVSSQRSYTVEKEISIPDGLERGAKHTVTGRAADWNGNIRQRASEAYVREYDVMEDPRLDIGVRYFQLGADMFGECLQDGIETAPAVDNYGGPIQPVTTTKHIDQMQGHGIGHVAYVVNGQHGEPKRIENFLASTLLDKIEVETGYWPSWDNSHRVSGSVSDRIEADMTLIKESFLQRENAATVNGRPVMVWGRAMSSVFGSIDAITEYYSDIESFVAAVRSLLTVDGTEPYLVAETGSGGYWGLSGKYARLARQFDGILNGKAEALRAYQGQVSEEYSLDEGQIPWDVVVDFMKQVHRGHRTFADEHDLGYYPVAFPGFDSRANTCWGHGPRYIPRSPSGFTSMLKLAEQFGTLDRILVATWNDWTEGTPIEPGTFRGTDHGKEYLERIREFQQPPPA